MRIRKSHQRILWHSKDLKEGCTTNYISVLSLTIQLLAFTICTILQKALKATSPTQNFMRNNFSGLIHSCLLESKCFMSSASSVTGQTSLCNTGWGFILPHLSQLEIKHLLYLSHPIPSMVSDEREACPEGNASRLNQACQVSGVVTSRR